MTSNPPKRTPEQTAFARRRINELRTVAERTLGIGGALVVLAIVLFALNHGPFGHESIAFYFDIACVGVGGILLFIGGAAVVEESLYRQFLNGPPKNLPPDPFEWLYKSGLPVHPRGLRILQERRQQQRQPPG